MRLKTVHRYRVLDLFCGEGGVAEGLLRHPRVSEVTGIDLAESVGQYYPGEFRNMGWMQAVERFAHAYDFIWASPPCQAYTASNGVRMNGLEGMSSKPKLIPAVREVLLTTGKPFVIENVSGARLDLKAPVFLQGDMFGMMEQFVPTPNPDYKPRGESKCREEWGCGNWQEKITLKLTRRRYFECHGFTSHGGPATRLPDVPSLTIVSGSDTAGFHRLGHRDPTAEECMKLMGITHTMTKHGVAEAIPPVYAEWIFQDWVDSLG